MRHYQYQILAKYKAHVDMAV